MNAPTAHRVPALALALALVAAGCERHREPGAAHVSQADVPTERAERIRPGPAPADARAFLPRPLPIQNPYGGDLRSIQEGRRLYRWMNCVGCHADGGGSIGPTLWDDEWRYGGRGIDIAESILYGRPNGMPAFAGHLPEDQVWKVVAYVESMEPHSGPYHFGRK